MNTIDLIIYYSVLQAYIRVVKYIQQFKLVVVLIYPIILRIKKVVINISSYKIFNSSFYTKSLILLFSSFLQCDEFLDCFGTCFINPFI